MSLKFRDPEQASATTSLSGFVEVRGHIELIRDRPWFIVPSLSNYGIPVELEDRRALSSPDLHDAWGDEKIDVYKINEDGTEETYFQ